MFDMDGPVIADVFADMMDKTLKSVDIKPSGYLGKSSMFHLNPFRPPVNPFEENEFNDIAVQTLISAKELFSEGDMDYTAERLKEVSPVFMKLKKNKVPFSAKTRQLCHMTLFALACVAILAPHIVNTPWEHPYFLLRLMDKDSPSVPGMAENCRLLLAHMEKVDPSLKEMFQQLYR
ncbi:MAG: hypothetical protein ACM3WV_08745 [Bacillota bacterium]